MSMAAGAQYNIKYKYNKIQNKSSDIRDVPHISHRVGSWSKSLRPLCKSVNYLVERAGTENLCLVGGREQAGSTRRVDWSPVSGGDCDWGPAVRQQLVADSQQ